LEVSGQLHALPLYSRRKGPRHSLDRRFGGPVAVLDDVEKLKFYLKTRSYNPRRKLVYEYILIKETCKATISDQL
jgi:hypothetical protein